LGVTIMSTTLALSVLYCVVAFAMSLFYGLRACEIFTVPTENRPRSWRIHQFWLNFLGSAVGWVAAWAVLQATLECASTPCSLSLSPSAIALFFLAFLGVTGHLPVTVVGAIGGVSKLIDYLLSLIGGKQ
jgi:hypothetical protein